MTSAKDRRHDGWVSPTSTVKQKYHDTSNDVELEPTDFYDEWTSQRDGQRDIINDNKKIKNIPKQKLRFYNSAEKRIKMNRKQKRLLKVRVAKKSGRSVI
jgi:hypothetical protein